MRVPGTWAGSTAYSTLRGHRSSDRTVGSPATTGGLCRGTVRLFTSCVIDRIFGKNFVDQVKALQTGALGGAISVATIICLQRRLSPSSAHELSCLVGGDSLIAWQGCPADPEYTVCQPR